ncbi:beta strand repeat-containing protein [Deinococcus sp. RM]|uniref:beta strand repeat-containing protein n=1 Tax=Deinococcus sp. RM TaxID=2316359 RepID=UPI000E67AD69|nr:hypothetical protein [Deinococcus sp. RM]RIY03929.1 hypothetical protein D3W47_12875 [Deinococcus sp. RM]
MTAPKHTPALILLTLTLAACGGGGGTPEPIGTPVTSLADSGAGSLRDTLAAAKSGDTLRLTGTGTLTLASPLSIDRDVTIIATGVTIDAAGKGRALDIAKSATVTMQGGTLKGGTGAVLPTSLRSAALPEPAGRPSLDGVARLQSANLNPQAVTVTHGGVLSNAGTLTLDGVTVTGGKANVGGGIYNMAGATLTLKGSTNVTGNEATVADPADSSLNQGDGGGIFNKGTLLLSGGSVSLNKAAYVGGGISSGTGSVTTISTGKVDGNRTTYPVTTTNGGTYGSGGGGIYSLGDLTITGGSVSGNAASMFGGGIAVVSTCVDEGCTTLRRPAFHLTGGVIENNEQTDTTGVGGGGGLWSNAANIITGGAIRANRADYGAGLNASFDTAFTGGELSGNAARFAGGGGLFLTQGPVYRIGGAARINGNTAVASGGGIQVGRSAQLTMDGGSISGNSVTGTVDGGGGVRITSGSTFNLAAGDIKGNTAVKTGGGITVNGTVNMTGGSITGNTVTSRTEGQGGGGGIRLYAGASVTASGGTISNNTAWFGGGVETNGAFQTSPTSTFVLSGATVSGNRADGMDGGGFWNDGQLTIQSGSVTGNSARNGGGVFNTRVGVYAQPGGSVTGNNPDNVFNSQ